MFLEEKKAIAELKVLRDEAEEIENFLEKAHKESRITDLASLEHHKKIVAERIEELEEFLYPDITA